MKLNYYLLILCMSLLMYSCKNEFESQGDLISVKLSPAFISLNQDTDVPMKVKGNNVKMSVDPNQVIYAIQVYENDSAYYYGLFDRVDSMKIAMTTGKSYHFKIATYKVGTGNGLKQDLLSDGRYFYLPNKTLLGNKFIKGNALKDINLISSAKLTTTTVKDYPEIDLFYCDKTVAADKGLANIDFNLLRMGFGVTYTVDGLTDGKLNIIMGNDTTELNSTTKTSTSIRLFKVPSGDLSTIFKNANTYADSILVRVEWAGAKGILLNTQGEFRFIRNYQKTINIQLNTANLNLNFEDWSNTVTDIDGNVYHTITIGNQVWMLENLKTTRYLNGDSIPNITNNNNWAALSKGAFCDYNNSADNSSKYGHLYNWFAVNDSRKIAPAGWHIPSDADWSTLTYYLGGENVAGGKLKEAGLLNWIIPNTSATNESGFTALPGGLRSYSDGTFRNMGSNCYFWSTTASDTLRAWDRELFYNQMNCYRYNYDSKLYGFSVRCVKD
jgi:uncharacterized protein (TIGR02145 family)